MTCEKMKNETEILYFNLSQKIEHNYYTSKTWINLL
jgi:hypothetical protein